MTTGDRPRAPDGRRGGPLPVGAPADEDRQQVAELSRQSAERRQQETEAMASAAEPAGVPPSDDQRQAIDALRERSAKVRGPAARALRRQPIAVGVVYDDERDQVAEMLEDARDRRLDDADQRGIVDPALEAESAGFPPDLPGLPGHELYGNFECPNCGNNVERAFPGYVDWDIASRDLVCASCGGVVRRGGQQAAASQPSEAAERGAEAYATQQSSGQVQPPGVQTSAQPSTGEALGTGVPGQTSGPGAQPLSADERAELEQLRAERADRERAEASSPPPEKTDELPPPPPTDQPPS